MAEPSRRTSRLTIAGATLGLLAAAAAGFFVGRDTRPTPVPAPAAPPPSDPPVAAAPLPVPAATLGRAELIAAAREAADAFSASQLLPDSVASLAGREFELRLPFGCPGVSPAEAMNADYHGADEVLRVAATPVNWSPGDWLVRPDAAGGAQPAETIEGFWIERPWTSSEACPAANPRVPADAAARTAAEHTFGIAEVFTPSGSRVGRRDGQAYEAVERVAPEALDLSLGLRLRLRGKLVQAPAPVRCRATSGTRPVCLLLVTFDEVAFENPGTNATLATWNVSSQSQATAAR